MDFKDKKYWAIILGGSGGLGLASAHKLARHGMNIIIVHRDSRKSLPQVETEFSKMKNEGVEVLSYNIDAMNSEKREETLQNIKENIAPEGKIRVLLHSVAKGNLKPMVDADFTLQNQDFHLTADAMAISLYDWVQGIFNLKIFAEDARVLSFTSQGNTRAWKGYAAVSVAKVALEAITRNIALEFAPHGIRANCLQAGTVETASFAAIPGSEELKERALKLNPFKRLTTAEEVANAVYVMSRDEASWINGCVIPVDGGEHLQ